MTKTVTIIMKRTAIAVVLIATSSMAESQAKKETSLSRAERGVKEVELKYSEAIKQQDTVALNEILADDFVAISSRGEVRTKRQETDDIKGSSDFQLVGFELDDLKVRVFRDTAVVTGRSTLRIIYKGQNNTSQFRYTRVYTRRKSGWQVVAQQLTRTSQVTN